MFNGSSTIRSRRLWSSPLAVRAYALARHAAERAGLQLVLKTYYSPIPDVSALPESTWSAADPLHGIELDLDAQLDQIQSTLAPFIGEFERDGAAGRGYEAANASYPLPDARLLHAMVRARKPPRVLELGSGQTTRVIARACELNAREGSPCEFRALDPFPTGSPADIAGLSAFERTAAQAVSEDTVAALGSGDILFVDTTHTVKVGSDVNHIILRLLPVLAPGVVVHFHDISLPYEYSRYLFEDYALYWAEQYMLQAFLCLNPFFEVLCATDALCRDRREQVMRLGLAGASESGSSFWIRRREPGEVQVRARQPAAG